VDAEAAHAFEAGTADSATRMGAGQDIRREALHERRTDQSPRARVIEDAKVVLALKDSTRAWSRAAVAILVFSVACGLVLRLIGLSAEGFADDEVHKWLAANRYLNFDIGGDDIEHPMLMKLLITLTLLIGRQLEWAPETIVRLPNVIAGAVSILVVAQLGRRLYGETAALIAAGLAAFSPTWIGYQRAGKEDTLLALFLMLLLWCAAEAKAAADTGRARAQRRWEWLGGGSLGAMFASKYFFFLAPIPVVLYLWMRATGTKWNLSLRRWFQLGLCALIVFALINWTPFLPSSWEYGLSYMAEKQTIHGSLVFMGELFHNLPSWGLKGTPPWFYLVFAAVKLAPPTVLLAAIGIVLAFRERRPSHIVILSWMLVWFLVLSLSGAKWGRFFISILPAFLLIAGHAAARIIGWFSVWMRNMEVARSPAFKGALLALVMIPVVGTEAIAAITHGPHYRLYISALGGGDRNINWFFPHCDYYDAGFREAIAAVAAKAEPGAELSTEIDWVAKHYTSEYGRSDLKLTLVRRGEACQDNRVCYVVVQAGRHYFLNSDAIENLAQRAPWHVERLLGNDAVTVYRLERGETPFEQVQATALPKAPDSGTAGSAD
jgi:4-amino-4-deoxy-L-arabinose transferase-like glycosyltransferase